MFSRREGTIPVTLRVIRHFHSLQYGRHVAPFNEHFPAG